MKKLILSVALSVCALSLAVADDAAKSKDTCPAGKDKTCCPAGKDAKGGCDKEKATECCKAKKDGASTEKPADCCKAKKEDAKK